MEILRQHAENQFKNELETLIAEDTGKVPLHWRMSPASVVTYLMGGTSKSGVPITPKYIGSKRLMEIAVATLLTDRALLLYGLPGTGKSWVSEHLTAAISGDSTMLIQGTAGTGEESLRYGWDYAQLLAKGPSKNALVITPVIRAMQQGKIVRIEELTRIPAEVQDTLITVLSEKAMPIPELDQEIQAVRGFNCIATANNRDKGVNELSGALKRRFNTVILPLPNTEKEEVSIVEQRVSSMAKNLEAPVEESSLKQIQRLVRIFRELRSGETTDGSVKLKSPSGTLSTAEIISVMNQGLALATHFGDGIVRADDIAGGMLGAIVKDPIQDSLIWKEYRESVLKKNEETHDIYEACWKLEN